jgi:sulfur-carrier protein
MQVFAKLYAILSKSLAADVLAQHPEAGRAGVPLPVELREGGTVADLIAALGLPAEQVRIVFVDGRARTPEYRLSPGDEVALFPPIGGG